MYESPYITQNASPNSGTALPDAPAGAMSSRPVVGVSDSQTPGRAVAEMLFDLLAEVPQAHHDPPDAVRRSSSSWWSMNGLPATSTSAFGIVSVIGRRRVARPPARRATGT